MIKGFVDVSHSAVTVKLQGFPVKFYRTFLREALKQYCTYYQIKDICHWQILDSGDIVGTIKCRGGRELEL